MHSCTNPMQSTVHKLLSKKFMIVQVIKVYHFAEKLSHTSSNILTRKWHTLMAHPCLFPTSSSKNLRGTKIFQKSNVRRNEHKGLQLCLRVLHTLIIVYIYTE